MPGYFGTESHRRLQRQAEDAVDFIDATAGACHTGRMMGCDDPERLGWANIDACIARDGAFGFRMLPADAADDLRARLSSRRCRLDTWDVFLGDRATALPASEAVLAAPLPDGLAWLDAPTDPEGETVARIQALMVDAGVVPFSGSFLVGDRVPATTTAIADRSGVIVAVAHAYLPHNASSLLHRHAWAGLVAVAPSQRGRGLGRLVNARIVADAFRTLGASHVYELVSAANLPSRRMVEACGVRHAPQYLCGIATPIDRGQFTK